MISGSVDSNLEPTVTLMVWGPTGLARSIPFVVDTGYSGEILLPPRLILDLSLVWVRMDVAELADGSRIEHRAFAAELDWDGVRVPVIADESDTIPLLGTKLLRGYELTAQMRPHGKLTLKKLPPRKRKARS